jgi:hypothetical protein
VSSSPGAGNERLYFISDYVRDGSMWIFVIAFAAFVILVARWQGATSLFGMVLSLLVILRFIIPGIINGYDPVVISVIGSVVIMASSLYLSHGINRKTTTALAGTAIALTITAILASVSISVARLSGLASDEASTLHVITQGGINAEGLLLAGMIIGALGVLDDVCVAQASPVFELKAANPALRGWDLFERRHEHRPRPHRLDGQHVVPGLRRCRAAFADHPFAADRAGVDFAQPRVPGDRDRANAGGQHRHRGLGAVDDCAGGVVVGRFAGQRAGRCQPHFH